MAATLCVAAAQFPVSGDIARNARYIEVQSRRAAAQGAGVIHFPEGALPGYGPSHFETLRSYDWEALERYTLRIRELARSLAIWVVLGSMEPVAGDRPQNCLHVISATGELAGTYAKRRIYRTEARFYSSGDSPLVVDVAGVRCGFLICHDNCFPELFEEYRDRGVELLFHSYHNAANRQATGIGELMRALLSARAADHQLWISASNSSARYSPLPACVVRPDGSMVRARRHAPGFVIGPYPEAELGWTYDNRKP